MRARVTLAPDFAAVDIPAILLRLGKKYAPVALAAVLAEWPVESGRSRAGWEVEAVLEGQSVRLVLSNNVRYAPFVTGPGSDEPIASTLAVAALQKVQAALDVEAEDEIAAALRAAPPRRRR